MRNIEVSEFTEEDWEIYKSLRLASLNESPDSFGSTFEREAAFSGDEWKSRLNLANGPARVLPLVGYLEGRAIGLAWGVSHDVESKYGHVYQMWVSPESRGLGIGRAFLTRIISWAKELQLSSLLLAVTTTNTKAVALYNSFGFLADAETEPLREGSQLLVQPMLLSLGASNA